MGDDKQVAGLDAELDEGVGGAGNGRSEHLSADVVIRLAGGDVDDGVFAVVGGEGYGVEQSVELGAGLLGKQAVDPFYDRVG